MFFSTELLSRRESGYGLLWLAATLGSKSKKLPRREIILADINQLCTLISEPPEPLALRLSSNLLVGVVRVFKMKHEIFETDVGNCVVSLKKNLNELHAIDSGGIEMAQPNGLREDALNLVVDPAMAMVMEFDVTLDDWDMVFRDIGEDVALREDHGFSSTINPGNNSSNPNFVDQRKLHQLDESHEYMFSSSFMNSFSGEMAIDGPSFTAAVNNNVLFDLEFGEPIRLGEEMERDLEEAWNIKIDDNEQPLQNSFTGPPDLDFGDAMHVFDEPFGSDVGFNIIARRDEMEKNDLGILDTEKITPFPDLRDPHRMFRHTPPPRGAAAGRSILWHQPPVSNTGNPENSPVEEDIKAIKIRRHKKRVMLIDPRTELTDDELKFQRFNYPIEMTRLRREITRKREIKEGKRLLEAELWAAPVDFAAPELVQLWNQRVAYPVKAREAAWRREVEDFKIPPKKRRLEEIKASGNSERLMENLPELGAHDVAMRENTNFDIGMFNEDVVWDGMDAYLPQDDPLYPAGRQSSDDPGQPRHAPSRPPSRVGSSLLGRVASETSQGGHVSNTIFPWDNAGPSSSNTPIPGSIGRSDHTFNFDSTMVRFRRGSSKGSARDSPAIELRDEPVDLEILGNEGDDFAGKTQESESMVTLERNSFNFLIYARMHMASDSGPLFFADIVPVESNSARIASEGFYHCLALATKDLIRLEQKDPFGPIKIEIK